MKIKWLICYIYAGGLGPARACSLVIQSFRMPEDELAEVGNVPTEGWIPLATA